MAKEVNFSISKLSSRHQRVCNELSKQDDRIYFYSQENKGVSFARNHGISKAKGLIKANRLKNKACKVFVMTGDGELQEGQIWESLNRLRQEKMKELTIIVDHNKFQSDRKISTTSDLGSLEKKFESFGLKAITCDGNNVDEFTSSLNALIATEEPGVLISNSGVFSFMLSCGEYISIVNWI